MSVSLQMRTLVSICLCLALTLGCGTTKTDTASSNVPRFYNGSSSAGDFVTITINPAARTLSYTNLSNQDSGTLRYEVNDDGSYKVNDPDDNLTAAYEVPNSILLVQLTQAGPSHDELGLIVATPKATIDPSSWAGQSYNYMQLQTGAGGIEVGSLNFDMGGNLALSGFSPYRAISGDHAYREKAFNMDDFQPDISQSFLTNSEDDGTFDYIFAQDHRILVVDTPQGTTLGLKARATKNFEPSFGGKYKAMYYQKVAARASADELETGTPILGTATLWISTSGQLTLSDSLGRVLLVATLQPVAEANYHLSSPGKIEQPCNGLFAFRLLRSNFQEEVFVAFADHTVLFSSFRAALPWNPNKKYDYLYGVGLR